MNWMGLLIGLLTFLLVVDCLILMLLILIQLPKKEAGLGTAFGSSTTDALFGAGTGTALTKLTRYAASGFLLIALTLSVMHNHRARQAGRLLSPEEIARRAQTLATTSGLLTPSNALPAAAPLTLSNSTAQPMAPDAATSAPPPANSQTPTTAPDATAVPPLAPEPNSSRAEPQEK
jgi:preprotein translocase subunit SecG